MLHRKTVTVPAIVYLLELSNFLEMAFKYDKAPNWIMTESLPIMPTL